MSSRGRERNRVGFARRRWIVPLAMGLVTALALAVYFTPVLGVRSVQVSGTTTLSQQDVVAAAGIPPGQPMLQVNTAAIRRKLDTVPRIASAEVRLKWPSTVQIDVTERRAVAFVATGGGFQLVDPTDVVFQTVPQVPAGLPQLQGRPDDAAGRAAITVLAGLPATLSAQVASVTAPTPDDVRLTLKDGRQVDWGSTAHAQQKAEILPPLLTQPGKVYDVRSTDLVTISG